MENTAKTKKIYAIMGTILAAIIVVGVLVILIRNTGNSAAIADRDVQIGSLSADNSEKSKTIDELGSEKSKLEAEISTLNQKISDLEASARDNEANRSELDSLREQLKLYSDQITALEEQIAAGKETEKVEKKGIIDLTEQARLIDELTDYINNECPYVRKLDGTDESGDPTYKWVRSEDVKKEFVQNAEKNGVGYSEDDWKNQEGIIYPKISFYYEDIANGWTMGVAPDEVYEAASVIKAPYILSVLETIARDEQKFRDKMKAENKPIEKIDKDGDGVAESDDIKFSDPSYDISEEIVYDKATMYKSGSGKIQSMDDGTTFTIKDFFEYTLLYSDNVAYQQLRKRYGYSTMTALASKLGTRTLLLGGNSMSARDAGTLFKEIYRFVQNDEEFDNASYGNLMKNAMLQGNHTVIIPAGVSPSRAMHKYGWDTNAYHDAAVVLDENPYVLAVFSDLDVGGDDVNAFLRGIVKRVNTIHKNINK